MPNVRIKRGANSSVSAYTGVVGELVLDTTNNALVLQDGVFIGGTTLAHAGSDGKLNAAYMPRGAVPEKPTLTSPADAATGVNPNTGALTTSAFSVLGYTDSHSKTQWQVATDAAFASIVYDSGDNVNLTSFTLSGASLSATTQYYWRARHKGTATNYGPWSDMRSFTTGVNSGEQVFTTPGSYNWVCPVGVTSVSAVVVGGGGGGGGDSVAGGAGGTSSAFGTSAFGGSPGTSSTFGQGTGAAGGSGAGGVGGNGGSGGPCTTYQNGGGGGGCGGYSGSGGTGGAPGFDGTAGSGGAAGGGCGSPVFNKIGTPGGGVGVYGTGSSGAGGSVTSSSGGGGGSGGTSGTSAYQTGTIPGAYGGAYGGGGGGGCHTAYTYTGGGGGGLRYINNYPVTAGNSYSIVVGSGGSGGTGGNIALSAPGGQGAVRIIWPGTTRTFPSAAA